MSNSLATFFLLTWIVTMTTGQVCITRYVDGEWRKFGDCQSKVSKQDVVAGITEMSAREERAKDIDKCATGVNQCHADATCINTRGSWRCKCNTGYAGDGVNCIGPGWKTSGSRFYQCFNKDRLSYDAAEARCASYGGRLAAEVLRDPVAARDIASSFVGADIPNVPWIGLEYIAGKFIWPDGGSMNNLTTGWVAGQPHNLNGRELCGHIWKISGDKLLLNDYVCDRAMRYICEI